jgi:hypothetical protein
VASALFLPPPCYVGCPREVDLREVLNAFSTSSKSSQQANDFPPYTTIQYYLPINVAERPRGPGRAGVWRSWSSFLRYELRNALQKEASEDQNKAGALKPLSTSIRDSMLSIICWSRYGVNIS